MLHSDLKLSTGFLFDALSACEPMVSKPKQSKIKDAQITVTKPKSTLLDNSCSQKLFAK